MKTQYMKRILTITATISSIVIGCQVSQDRTVSDSRISDFAQAKNCGMLATIGETSPGLNAAGKFARLPGPVTLTAQIIACGNVSATSDENWHAIGVGIERRTIMIEDRTAGSKVEAQPVLESDGSISLYVNNAVALKLGSVPGAEVGMPIGIGSGLTFEIRAGSAKIDLTTAKSTPSEQMSLWIVK